MWDRLTIQRLFALMFLTAAFCMPRLAHAQQAQIKEMDQLQAAVLVEVSTGTRLFVKEPDTARAVAGLCKLPAILTLAQAFDDELISESDIMRISAHAASLPGPTAFLEEGEQIAASELIKSAIMISGGDAIMALGENAFGSESVFCDNIAVTMRQLGLNKVPPDALCTGMSFSAWELATLGMEAAKSDTFQKYCTLYLDSVAHPDGRETELVNANRLLNNYAGCSGLMTGSSPTDGYCGIFCAERGNTRLITVIVGAPSALTRTSSAVTLLDYGFANFHTEMLSKPGVPLATSVPVRSGNVKTIDLITDGAHSLVLTSTQGKLMKEFDVPEYLEAPLSIEQAVGSVSFVDEKGAVLSTLDLYPAHAVEAFGIRDILLRILGRFVA